MWYRICLQRNSDSRISLRLTENSSNMNFFVFVFFGDNFGLPGSGSGSADPFESGSVSERLVGVSLASKNGEVLRC
jgi:hypothetical protein